jgi:hypothetical protein
MAGQFLKNPAKTGRIGKTKKDCDLGNAPGARAEEFHGRCDSLAIHILLIRHAHYFPEHSRKMGRRHAGLSGNGAAADVGVVVIVDIQNGPLDFMVRDMGDGGRRSFRIKVGGRAAPEYSGNRIQVAVFRDKEIEYGRLTFLDFFHRETSLLLFIIEIPDVSG